MFRPTIHAAVFVFAATIAAHAEPGLAMERMALHQFEDGPLLAGSYEFLPGETAYFSCRMSGYKTEQATEEQRLVKISWRAEVLDPGGIPTDTAKEGKVEGRLSPQDKDYIPKFLLSFVIPPFAPSGRYRVVVKAKDEIGGSEVNAELPFRVRGHEVEPSETLAARNFRFLSSEDDNIGTHAGVYRPGDTLWARFDMIGYKFGDNNRFAVECAMAVENADGKRLFTQSEAASQSGDSYYPQRYVPILLNVSLDKSVKPATYTLVVILRDTAGGQTWELREPFLVQ